MRKAAIDRAWQQCREGNFSRLAVHGMTFPSGDEAISLAVSSRVIAFVGKNGAGKTSLLRSIYHILAPHKILEHPSLLFSLTGRYNGQDFRVPDELPKKKRPAPTALLVDASAQAHKLLDFFRIQKELPELLASYGFKRMTNNEAAPFNFLCGRNYEHVEIAEIEGPSPTLDQNSEQIELDIFPFFRVRLDGKEYDALSMGFGELCAFYVIWSLTRARKGSVVLFDEPDSHLSPAARRALASVIAMVAADRELWIAFSSHSPEALEALNDSELYLVDFPKISSSHPVSLAGARRRTLRALGITPIKRLLIVVEDVDAEEVAIQILNRFADDIAGAVDIQKFVAGATEVVRFVDSFPPASRIGRCIALLDGDKRDDFANNNVLYLPGTDDPVAAARKVVTANPLPFANLLGIDADRLVAALRSIRGSDHHDFCSALLDELRLEGTQVSVVRRALVSAWLSEESTADEGSRLAAKLVELVDKLPFLEWSRAIASN